MAWIVAATQKHAKCRQLLQDQGFEAYTPLYKEKKFIRGKKRWLISYLFGRYFFVRWSEDWARIAKVRYVDGILHNEGEPPPVVKDDEISALRSREIGGFVILRGFRRGQQVRVKTGPLVGQIGQFAGFGGRDREVALFDFMGQQSRIEFAPGVLVAA